MKISNFIILIAFVIFYKPCSSQQNAVEKQDSVNKKRNWSYGYTKKVSFQFPTDWCFETKTFGGITKIGIIDTNYYPSIFFPIEIWEITVTTHSFQETCKLFPEWYFKNYTREEKTTTVSNELVTFKNLKARKISLIHGKESPVDIIMINGKSKTFALVHFKVERNVTLDNEILDSIKISNN